MRIIWHIFVSSGLFSAVCLLLSCVLEFCNMVAKTLHWTMNRCNRIGRMQSRRLHLQNIDNTFAHISCLLFGKVYNQGGHLLPVHKARYIFKLASVTTPGLVFMDSNLSVQLLNSSIPTKNILDKIKDCFIALNLEFNI